MAFGFFGLRRAEGQLLLSRARQLPPPHDLPTAIVEANWRAAQDHRRVTVATDAGAMVLSALLFIAGSRVLLRPRGGGWLWRQALAANLVLCVAGIAVDHALRPGRVAAMRALLTDPATRIPLPEGLHVGDVATMPFSIAIIASWVAAGLLAAALVYASRERTRTFLDA